MLKVKGSIPDEIAILSSIQRPVYQGWEEGIAIENGQQVIVTPAFISDASNPRTIASAITWAENARRYYDEKTRQQIVKSDPVKKEVKKNLPFRDMRVVTLEYRGNGGRAYKVITPDNYYFDLREDVLVEAMLKEGVRAGGYVNGEFIWARVNTSMKIVRIGSELHEALVSANEKRTLTKIANKEFVPGGVYETKSNERYIFIGWVDSTEYPYTYSKAWMNASMFTRAGSSTVPSLDVSRVEVRNKMLWFRYPWRSKRHDKETWEKMRLEPFSYYIEDKMNVVKLIDTYELEPNHILMIREKACESLQEFASNSNPMDMIPHMSARARIACLRPAGMDLPDPDEYLEIKLVP